MSITFQHVEVGLSSVYRTRPENQQDLPGKTRRIAEEGGIDVTLWRTLIWLFVGVAFLWETRPAYSMAYLGIILFFLFPLWQEKAAQKLRIERSAQEYYLFPGDRSALALEVTNPTFMPLVWISIIHRIPSSLVFGNHPQRPVFALPPHGSHEVNFEIMARERGVYRLGPLDVCVGDPFGVRTQKYLVEKGNIVVVFPAIHQLSDLSLPARFSFGNFKAIQQINPDPTRLAGLRRYQEGDQLRSIHWPATARTKTLQVKQFEHTVTATCMLFLDLYKQDYQTSKFHVETELAITTAASLVHHLIQRGEACGLAANAVLNEYLPGDLDVSSGEGVVRIPPRQGTAQLRQVLTVLAGVKAQDGSDFSTLLTECGHQLEGAAILLWVVPRDTPEIVERAWDYVRRGRQVQVFVVGDVQHRELLQSPLNSALRVFSVTREGAILP